jgi:hypothetical protein
VTLDRYRLGIDFGTSTTVAVLAWPDGMVKPLVFDGSELLPSAVCVDGDGTLMAGRDALHAARRHPGGFEPHPKRSIDDGVVLLADTEVTVTDLFAVVLGRVAAEAYRVAGGPVGPVTVTCPAGWGSRRREILMAAASAAGLGPVTLVAEPVAAACYFVAVAGATIPIGSSVVIYDFGAGTFDASVVRRTESGFAVLAEHGLPDVGGLDIDSAIVAYLGTVYAGRNPDLWKRLVYPVSVEDRRAARLLWDDVRTGKEILSRMSTTLIHVPLFLDDAPLGRGQLEQLARPMLDRTVRTTRGVLRAAGVSSAEVAGLFLVGGSSRIPLAATLLHQALELAPTVIERPELVVAEGSLRTDPSVDRKQTPTAIKPPKPAEVASDGASGASDDPAVSDDDGTRAVTDLPLVDFTPDEEPRRWRTRQKVIAAGLSALAVAVLIGWAVLERSAAPTAPTRAVAGSPTSVDRPTGSPSAQPAKSVSTADTTPIGSVILTGSLVSDSETCLLLRTDATTYAVITRRTDRINLWNFRTATIRGRPNILGQTAGCLSGNYIMLEVDEVLSVA